MFTSSSVASRIVGSSMLLRDLSYSQVLPYPGLVLQLDVVVFAQGMATPVVRQQNASQVGMAGELDAEHIEDLPFEPVSGHPDAGDRGRHFVLRHAALD